MSFDNLELHPSIIKAVKKCGYTRPTPIQVKAIPVVLAGRDLIASAQTGTGKTAAFMLPILHGLSQGKRGRKGAPKVLVLSPTRELADQVTQATRTYGRYTGLKSAVILGGVSYKPQFKALSQPIDLVVGTPGRLIDHLERGSLDLSMLEVLVLDEADRMLDMGFKRDVEKISAAAPAGRQTLLFTATLDRSMEQFASRLLRNPERIDVAGRKLTLDAVEQHLYVADGLSHKKRLLFHMASDQDLTRAIVFSATKRAADGLARDLRRQGHKAVALHGDMSQAARNRTMKDMRRGNVKLLVATDVAARGLDVSGISHVINFDLPRAAQDYVHRIGRTGRAGARGIAISFASGGDDALQLNRIDRFIGKRLSREEFPGLEPEVPLAGPVKNVRSFRPRRQKKRFSVGLKANAGSKAKRQGRRIRIVK